MARAPRIAATDLDVFPLCLGGNVFGWTTDEATSFTVLDAYAAAGGNFIDTADVYSSWVPGHAGGESESIIGRWMAARGNRDDLVIATKVAKLESRRGLSAENIRAAADDSLRRLGTDRIDLYYAHEDDAGTPMEETLGAFDALIRDGKVRYVAASNFGAERLDAALGLSADSGLASYVALQPEYNLVARAYEGALRDVCESALTVLRAVLRAGDGIPHRQVPAGRRARRQSPRLWSRQVSRRARPRGARGARRDRSRPRNDGRQPLRSHGSRRNPRSPLRSRARARQNSLPTCCRWQGSC